MLRFIVSSGLVVTSVVGVSQVAAAQPDLAFASPTIQVLTIPGQPMLAAGQTLVIPCENQGNRAYYWYANFGNQPAGPHATAGLVQGSAMTYTFAQAALAQRTRRRAIISFPQIPLPNVVTAVRIRLDVGNVVAEANEANNTWTAFMMRQCP